MEELLRAALEAARAPGVAAADVRVISPGRYLHLAVRNGEASALTDARARGIGVRVRTDRAWGFAASSELDRASARDVGTRAVRLANAAGANARSPLRVTEEPGPRGGRYRTPMRQDPFEVPAEEVLGLLSDAERRLHVGRELRTGGASFEAWEETKWYAASDGSDYRSRIVHVGAGVSGLAVRGASVQRRSAPTSFGGNFAQAGFEFVRGLDLVGSAEAVGREAVALLGARACPTGRTTLVLGSDQLALQVHESVGHAVELDRILGSEAGYAGRSWVGAGTVGSLRYGSDRMNVTATALQPGGLGSFAWDDEGVRARATPIVRRGVLVGLLTSRESAAQAGLERSGGTARAQGANRAPLVRMTNINLEPGDRPFDELLDGVQDGVYLETNRSWSIDDRRLNFQFGTEVGRTIRKGELGELLRNPIYAGMTPTFWGTLDAVGDRSTWRLWGIPGCGKGQPGQIAHVGHGAPAARFRDVDVRGG